VKVRPGLAQQVRGPGLARVSYGHQSAEVGLLAFGAYLIQFLPAALADRVVSGRPSDLAQVRDFFVAEVTGWALLAGLMGCGFSGAGKVRFHRVWS
jgi:hypothetical protein